MTRVRCLARQRESPPERGWKGVGGRGQASAPRRKSSILLMLPKCEPQLLGVCGEGPTRDEAFHLLLRVSVVVCQLLQIWGERGGNCLLGHRAEVTANCSLCGLSLTSRELRVKVPPPPGGSATERGGGAGRGRAAQAPGGQ